MKPFLLSDQRLMLGAMHLSALQTTWWSIEIYHIGKFLQLGMSKCHAYTIAALCWSPWHYLYFIDTTTNMTKEDVMSVTSQDESEYFRSMKRTGLILWKRGWKCYGQVAEQSKRGSWLLCWENWACLNKAGHMFVRRQAPLKRNCPSEKTDSVQKMENHRTCRAHNTIRQSLCST